MLSNEDWYFNVENDAWRGYSPPRDHPPACVTLSDRSSLVAKYHGESVETRGGVSPVPRARWIYVSASTSITSYSDPRESVSASQWQVERFQEISLVEIARWRLE
jgi:hypothetical protein